MCAVSSTPRYPLWAPGLGWTPCAICWLKAVHFGLRTGRSVMLNKQMNASRQHGNAITDTWQLYKLLWVTSLQFIIPDFLGVICNKAHETNAHCGCHVGPSSCCISLSPKWVDGFRLIWYWCCGFNKVYITSQNVDIHSSVRTRQLTIQFVWWSVCSSSFSVRVRSYRLRYSAK